jgi:hypothetical protein
MLRAADRHSLRQQTEYGAEDNISRNGSSRAQHKIFNKLCIAYRRSRQNPAFRIRAEDVRNELAIPEMFSLKHWTVS